MRTLSEAFGLEMTTQNLAKNEMQVPVGVPFGKKETTAGEERLSLFDLERLWIEDPIVFNGVNTATEIVMAAGYSLKGNEKSVEAVTRFISNIGKTAGNCTWDELLYTIYQHQFLYGRAYIERMYSPSSGELVDLDFIDPKYIDYAKDSNGNIALDKYGNPLGYVQKVPSIGASNIRSDGPIPKEVEVSSDEIFIKPDKVIQFNLFTAGSGFYGVGLVEPIYRTGLDKSRLREAITNLYLQLGPRQIVKIGNETHEPTAEMMARVVQELERARYNSVFAVPYYADIDIKEAKHPERLQNQLDFLTKEEIAVLGPAALITGGGEATNRSTLNRQESVYKLKLQDAVKRTTTRLERELFSIIIEQEGLKEVPRIVGGEIDLVELDSKADRLAKLAKTGVITPDSELEKHIRELEDLPLSVVKPRRDDDANPEKK
ncbi:MAG: phage portal protein family protein [Candidatus Heimdallarchaeaceae archaeon]